MAGIDISKIIKSTAPAVPQIYAYTTPEIARHNGWTKIGYTEQDVRERIKQQTHTADVQWHLEWSGNATWEHRAGTFHDTDFHAYLEKQGVKREPKTEWFKISGEESHQQFYRFRDTDGVLDAPGAASYTLRAEQQRAVEQTGAFARAHWDEDGASGGEFLWNAKPRFGKTLTAYDLCRSIGAQKVLIVTNRPAIANSWYDDYVKFVGVEGGYRFISGVDALAGKPYCLSREEYLRAIHNDPEGPKGFIEFVSLQDLKGSIHFGGVYRKLDEVADLTWDVLIIDEAHEGVDTFKTDVAFDHIKRRFTLHLSGTPFKAIANEKFADDAIYNWTYADEQQAKRDWPADSEQPNPYANLPKLNLLTYQMSDIVEQEARGGMEIDGEQTEFAFDLNEFFSTKQNGGFVHDADVDKFLDALTTQEKFPFSTPELRDELRHTFWMLNRVDSARALAKKLQAHPVFKDYEVVLAAGDGKIDADDENEKSLDKVRRAIKDHDRTITLSVGQLTTGVTVPEWTAVLMLSNMASPALYMQAAFRSQNPCLFDLGGGNYARKENAYVFDFDPARTLTIFEQFANDLYGETARGGGDVETRERHIRQLLNFFPVYGEDDEGQMVELDAEQVLSVPRRIHAREVVKRGFMSNFLFQNIASVFHAPTEVVEIIQRFDPYEQGKAQNAEKNKVAIDEGTADELSINDKGEVEIPDKQVVGKAADIFGPKVYGDIAVEFSNHVDDIAKAHEANDDDRAMLYNLKEAFKQSVTAPLVQAAKESYGSELKPRQQQQIERKVQADADIQLNRQVGDYQIQARRIEQSRKDELKAATSETERAEVNQRHDEQKAEAFQALAQKLEDSREELVQSAGETVVREVETAKKEEEKQGIEDKVRAHLRGFSRTIPSFLMAYGEEGTTLANFDTVIPADVFLDVTSITVDEFRFLRDGGDYIDAETGEVKHFVGHLFDEVVFNDSVSEFVKLRERLANYFDESQVEDIFDYVPPQKTNQIFTPRNVVVEMVDLFEKENPGCFDDPSHTFADLYMKSGLYITEIIKRLYRSEGMKAAFPDDRERLDHILERQVFGIAPTKIIYEIATHFILGFHDEVGQGCDSNFELADSAELAKEDTLDAYVERVFGPKLGEA
ncbi:DEAD/DEAH box helicase family protein [Bifidobacterium pseudolongum]|uniref:DEAD/DEAH box helicase n=1 Tax=Bifidobacterium pseudolongum TaxID=1694 RepID=UPI00047CB7EA|nr:DEAD/DEAH box helicase family protein [Bifidobacterium pseudolongum]ATO40143.1 restriction endonuclease [Bifidobacterium pseudolongum subsp. globosum DSM 20092]KFI78551.1 type II restriction endonuclease [Bifidobacterium pseudolongum subsp. globosum]UBY93826.1 DEAD/DEAH box helicase family protein [Bifidobacterium pseudolongum]UBZ02660.1 DEAD/DEAH box helicase family protein [Bifidobacterium pseudolongum]UBZ04230.1 DEAD/DEAH box helicase family protein [Bifidobacterium pseudolongum]